MGKVTSKYWETWLPSQASGRSGGRPETSPGGWGGIEEWAPGLPAAISGGLEWNPLWGDLVQTSGHREQHRQDRASSEKNLGQTHLGIWPSD